ncbi:MAG: hypothetical protein DDT38_00546 [Firmicutes bacterium]|nr:hypothetical protein [candidate division NPL-UPA2 bacterium]
MKVLYVLPPDVSSIEVDESRLHVFRVVALLSRQGSVPEVVGPHAGHYIRQFADTNAWTNGLSAAVSNLSQRQTMARASLLRSRAFTWERAARDFLALYSRRHLSLG